MSEFLPPEKHMNRPLTDEERAEIKARQEEEMAAIYRCNACDGEFGWGRLSMQGCPHCGEYQGFQRSPPALS